jgi:hypothetical protein
MMQSSSYCINSDPFSSEPVSSACSVSIISRTWLKSWMDRFPEIDLSVLNAMLCSKVLTVTIFYPSLLPIACHWQRFRYVQGRFRRWWCPPCCKYSDHFLPLWKFILR